jgi:nitrogen fixation/metabolism regulation signal transduction histidine kinase
MAGNGRIERRLSAAIVLTALIPLLGAVYLAKSMVSTTADRFFVPEIGARLDEALGLYQELARADKNAMRQEAAALAAQHDIVSAVRDRKTPDLQRALEANFADHPSLVSLSVVQGDKRVASVDRKKPVTDDELTLELRRPLGGRVNDDAVDDDGPSLVAVFASDKARYDGLERMSEFVDTYGKVASRRKADERSYLLAFAVLLGLTIAAAIFIGTQMARRVSTRIVRLADATRKAGAGDLTTRVEETGSDEVTDLTHAFNRMVAEIEATRARIEYLQRIGAWQEMARRLAHEIKNPLTPIQLAVEEIHQRYTGDDEKYRRLLDATLEVVQAEVGTLGRLVGEFSDFARLPQAHLVPADLARFLRDQATERSAFEDGSVDDSDAPRMTISFDIPDGEAQASIDRQMLRRVFINLVRNSGQALRDAGRTEGRVKVTLRRAGDYWVTDIDDDGPGIPDVLRERIFDPYVTTKEDGTGLGLAIVKKVIVEHGGVITALASPLGGARMRVTMPVRGTAASDAALEAVSSERAPHALTTANVTSKEA